MNISYLVFGIACITALTIAPNALGVTADSGKNAMLDKFQLKINQTALEPNNIALKFLNVTADSRCSSDVTCIWQGESTIVVDITKNNQDLGNFNLKSGLGDNNATVQIPGGYFLQLIKVEPYPTSGTKIQLSNYISTFTLSQAGVASPLKQFKSGISAQQVQCKTGLELVIKAENSYPACVSHSSVSALMSRGWAIVNTIADHDLSHS